MTLLVYKRSPHFLRHCRSAFAPQQHRGVHLFHAANQRSKVGNHGLKDYVPVGFLNNWDKLLATRLKLWSETPGEVIDPAIELRQVIANHIKPGICLLPLNTGNPTLSEYKLFPLKVQKLRENYKSAKRAAFEFHFRPTSPEYFTHQLQKAYALLDIGRVVEIHIHQALSRVERKIKLQNAKNKIPPPKDIAPVRKMVEDNLHFHPEAIRAALPVGTTIAIEPQSNYSELVWVFGPGLRQVHANPRTRRFVKVPNMNSAIVRKRRQQFALDARGAGQLTKRQAMAERQRREAEGGEAFEVWTEIQSIERKLRKGEVKIKKLTGKLNRRKAAAARKLAEKRKKPIVHLKSDGRLEPVDVRRVSRGAGAVGLDRGSWRKAVAESRKKQMVHFQSDGR